MSVDKVKESATDALETASMAVYDKEEFEKLDDDEVKKLCSDYAAYTRVNLSEEHGQVTSLFDQPRRLDCVCLPSGSWKYEWHSLEWRIAELYILSYSFILLFIQIVTSIAAIEEQLQSFTEMVELIGSDK